MAIALFKPGNPGGPGRRKGSRNKLAESFLDALHRDFQAHGVEAIEAARAESPLGYVKLIAGLSPQKFEVEASRIAVSDDDLLAIIRQAHAADEPDALAGEIDPPLH